jgi:peroxiredoxin
MNAVLFAFTFFASAHSSVLPSEFQGQSVFGDPLHLRANSPAKGTVLVFLSAKCPCSASHEQDLRALSTEFSKKGFQFIGVHSNTDESFEVTRSHFKGAKLPFPILEDSTQSLAEAFRAYKTPHAFVLDPRGELVYQGGVDDSHMAPEAKRHFLKDALIALTEGKKPNPAEARALGCVIKRKEKP